MVSQLTSVPNLLTLGRVAAVPLICLLVAIDTTWSYVLAFILYVAAAISDYLDGYLARAWKQGSAIGRMLDPIADKALVGALLIVLAWTQSLSGWDLIPAVAIMLREILVSGLREYLGPKNVVVHVTPLAKWKTTTQLVALGVILLAGFVPGLAPIGQILLWIAGILTVWTGYDYYRGAWPHLVEDAP
jgi:CDP-diacylglycerol--glycerol-3-phosphate 3-phosphatidyltransferase